MDGEFNRRDFLRAAGVMFGSGFLAACAPEVSKAVSNPGSAKVDQIPAKPVSLSQETSKKTIDQASYVHQDLVKKVDAAETVQFDYFSQLNYPKEYAKGGHSWAEVGCGIMTAGMVSWTEPIDYYYRLFLPYFRSLNIDGKERITGMGSELKDHKNVLESIGFKFSPLPTANLKLDIEKFTQSGIPVWIRGNIFNMARGHHTMAVGTYDSGYLLNDPLYGQRVRVPDSKIKVAEAFAVYPPKS